MKKRQTIKNVKRVSCRFDMDVPEERRAWQILQGNYQEPPDGKKQDYTSIIAKAMTGYYDRKEDAVKNGKEGGNERHYLYKRYLPGDCA